MAISICYECKEKISTDLEVCPHCGNKIKRENYNAVDEWEINGINYNLTPFMDDIMSKEVFNDDVLELKLVDDLRALTGCASMGSLYWKLLFGEKIESRVFRGPTMEEMRLRAEERERINPMPKCPTCGSTNLREIGFGERTLSVNLFGLSSNKLNKTFECNNCGYTW